MWAEGPSSTTKLFFLATSTRVVLFEALGKRIDRPDRFRDLLQGVLVGIRAFWTCLYSFSFEQVEKEEAEGLHFPEGPSNQCLRTLVPKTIIRLNFRTREPKCWVLGSSGSNHPGPIIPFKKEPSYPEKGDQSP